MIPPQPCSKKIKMIDKFAFNILFKAKPSMVTWDIEGMKIPNSFMAQQPKKAESDDQLDYGIEVIFDHEPFLIKDAFLQFYKRNSPSSRFIKVMFSNLPPFTYPLNCLDRETLERQ
ncbi:hypothetical protein Tco_0564731 [Tanacetum coccineum]